MPKNKSKRMKKTPTVEIWDPKKIMLWSAVFTPILGAYLCSRNWQTLGFPEKERVSMKWFYASLTYYLSLPIAVHLASRYFIISPAVEITMIILPLLVWVSSPGMAQLRYVKSANTCLYPEKSWRVPLTVAFGILFGAVGVLVSFGLALALINPITPQ